MLISPGSTCFVSSSNIDQRGGGGRVGAKRELIFHASDRSLVQKQSFLNNFVQDCSLTNLVPRVLGLFGQRVRARRDSGIIDLNYIFDWPLA